MAAQEVKLKFELTIHQKVKIEVEKLIDANPGLTLKQYRTVFRIKCPYPKDDCGATYNYWRKIFCERMKEMFPGERSRQEAKIDRHDENSGPYFTPHPYYRNL